MQKLQGASQLDEHSIAMTQKMDKVTVPIKIRAVMKGIVTGWADLYKEDNSWWVSFGQSGALTWVRIWLSSSSASWASRASSRRSTSASRPSPACPRSSSRSCLCRGHHVRRPAHPAHQLPAPIASPPPPRLTAPPSHRLTGSPPPMQRVDVHRLAYEPFTFIMKGASTSIAPRWMEVGVLALMLLGLMLVTEALNSIY